MEPQSGVKNLLKDWPDNYREIHARVLPGISSEYPCVAWSQHEEFTYLISCSLFCAMANYRLTRSQRSKFDAHGGPSLGFFGTFVVLKDPVKFKDFTVKAFQMGMRDCSHLPTNLRLFKVNCVLSEELPQRCYSKELGNVILPPRVLNATPIPNVVYEAFVECKVFIKNDDGSRIDANTQVEIRPELARIIRVKPLQSRLYTERRLIPPVYSEHVEILRRCPWNTLKVERGEIKPQIIYWNYGDDGSGEQSSSKHKADQTKPPFPTRALSKVRLWYFENNRTIRARFPKTLVKITLGTEKMVWESISIDSRLRYPSLEEGQFFYGWIVYNEFISCYYVQNYRLPKEGESLYKILEKRIVIDNGNPVNEYYVNIRESTLCKGLYVCDPLENILIADPNLILRNISLDDHRIEGCPVWIRLEPEHERLTHFSISELNKSVGKFSAAEKMMSYPNICGIGILVDLETNTVFSENHPQKRILLSNADKFNVKLGNFFYFSAAYWPLRQLYLIGNYQFISAKRRIPVNTFCIGNKLIFEEYFRYYTSYTFQMDGSNFGPISDPMSLIEKKTRKEKVDWPSKGHGFVSFNPDWQAGRSCEFILYSLDLDKEAQCVTSSFLKQELNWWKHHHIDANGLCRCDEIWHLLYSIKQKAENELFNEEKKEFLKKTLETYQNQISST